ncbi:hypothetical protein ScPMuIL_002511 [Solemya velum]
MVLSKTLLISCCVLLVVITLSSGARSPPSASSPRVASSAAAASSDSSVDKKKNKRTAVVTGKSCTIYKKKNKKKEHRVHRVYNVTEDWCAKMTFLCGELDKENNTEKYENRLKRFIILTGHKLCCKDLSNACNYVSSDCLKEGTCECASGSRQVDWHCEDIDECAEGLHNCHPKANCKNIEGSFFCECNGTLVGDGVESCVECSSDVGWSEVGHLCVSWVNAKANWQTSESYCTFFGGRLLELDSDEDYDAFHSWIKEVYNNVTTFAFSPFWMGAQSSSNGQFMWTDSTVMVDPNDPWVVPTLAGLEEGGCLAGVGLEDQGFAYANSSCTAKLYPLCRFLG